jgi:hypothetical protein
MSTIRELERRISELTLELELLRKELSRLRAEKGAESIVGVIMNSEEDLDKEGCVWSSLDEKRS